MIKTAEIITIGTELLLGEVVDTNSTYLAAELANKGVNIFWSLKVGDNMARIVEAINLGLRRSDLLILTGGLGPTDDDMTREAIAQALGEKPKVDKILEKELRERFAKFSKHMPEQNLKQAWLIDSAQTLANPIGTAPGWLVKTTRDNKERIIITLPGPPRELKRMWSKEALPKLELADSALFTRTFKTQNFGESAVAEALGELTKQNNPSVATYARRDGVHVRVAAKADSHDVAQKLARNTVKEVENILNSHVWGYDDDDLAEIVIKKLQEKELTLATFENISGGKFAAELNSVSDASQVYIAGMVGYKLQVLTALGLEDRLEPKQNDEKSLLTMAKTVAKIFDADIGMVIYGANNPNKTKIMVSIYDKADNFVKSIELPQLERAWIQERAAFAALSLLNKRLS